MRFQDLDKRLHAADELDRKRWRRHRRGGGWVEKSATVAPTAFIGPTAIVLGNAQVLDDAHIDGDALITSTAIVAGHVYIGGRSRVGDCAKISGRTRIIDADVGGFAVITHGTLAGEVFRPRGPRAQREWKLSALVRD